MTNVTKLYAGGLISKEQQDALVFHDDVITRCINDLKESGIPQGLIVALLHGHATAETIYMMSEAGDGKAA